MAYTMYSCKTTNSSNTNGHLVFDWNKNTQVWYLQNGYSEASYSTTNGSVLYSKSCSHSNWSKNTRTYRISMDTALRNAVTSKIDSGGLVNLQNYISNITELQGRDLNGNNSMNVFGFICRNRSITGSFDATNFGFWEGNWPYNFPLTLWYSYSIPGVGDIADTITLITDGWYTRGSSRLFVNYPADIHTKYTDSQLLNPPKNWNHYDPFGGHPSFIGPFEPANQGYSNTNVTLGYYTINGIYSRNTGCRNCYSNNAADTILNAGSNYFGGLTLNNLVSLVGAPNKRMYVGNDSSITNKIILAITDVDFVNNTITVSFAFNHDRDHSMVAFLTSNNRSIAACRINYSFPVTTIHRITDNWNLTFVNDSSFNPTEANGQGPSTLIWDSSNNDVVLTAGSSVNNGNGYSKIISRSQGTLACSCTNVSGTVRLTIGGYTLTIPSNVQSFLIRILSVNNGQLGYWRITPPNVGFAHSFSIVYPSTENAPLVSFENELYTAIVEAVNDNGVPYLFSIASINDQFSITVTGVVRCDRIIKNGKQYFSVSIYDVNGDFSALLVKNGTYVTMPVTITVDIQIINNTLLIKAGLASIGFTSTSIGDVSVNVDAVAVMLPAVASISKNGARIGYATTTVNQSSFAFSFSADKNEVEQTDDFVSHYLQ